MTKTATIPAAKKPGKAQWDKAGVNAAVITGYAGASSPIHGKTTMVICKEVLDLLLPKAGGTIKPPTTTDLDTATRLVNELYKREQYNAARAALVKTIPA